MTLISINGTDWSGSISDVTLKPKGSVVTKKNVKGDVLTIPPRTTVPSIVIQLHLPYLTAAQMQTLLALFQAQAPVVLSHTLDFPQGNYVPTDFAKTRINSRGTILYTVMFTLNLDNAPTLPVPAFRNDLAVGGINRQLGL